MKNRQRIIKSKTISKDRILEEKKNNKSDDHDDEYDDAMDEDIDAVEGEDDEYDDDEEMEMEHNNDNEDEEDELKDQELQQEKQGAEEEEDIHDGKTKLASAMARILSKAGPSSSVQKRPILGLQRSIERAIDDEKLELRARKALALEKKKKMELGRKIPQVATDDFERRLRKIATRGVVKLFNAIRTAQKSVDVVQKDGVQKNAALVPKVSKVSFLKMIQETSKSSPAEPTLLTSSSSTQRSETSQVTTQKLSNIKPTVSWTSDDYMLQPKEKSNAPTTDQGKAWDLDSD